MYKVKWLFLKIRCPHCNNECVLVNIIETYSRLEVYNYIILLYNGSSAQREEQVEKE